MDALHFDVDDLTISELTLTHIVLLEKVDDGLMLRKIYSLHVGHWFACILWSNIMHNVRFAGKKLSNKLNVQSIWVRYCVRYCVRYVARIIAENKLPSLFSLLCAVYFLPFESLTVWTEIQNSKKSEHFINIFSFFLIGKTDFFCVDCCKECAPDNCKTRSFI